VNPANMEPYVAPYVQVRHAIHLLYATSPRSRDGNPESDLSHRFDKHGNRFFNGFVTEFAQTGYEERFHLYRATIRPWFWFLTRGSDCRIFQKKTVKEIFEAVVKGYGFNDYKLKLGGTYPTRDYCVQYRETDFNFLSRLLEEEGIHYFFEHEDGKHFMILGDNDAKSHMTVPGYDKVPYFPPTLPAAQRSRDHLLSWGFSKSVRTGHYATTDYDFTAPKKALLETATRLLMAQGFTRRQAARALLPLTRQTVDNFERIGPRAAWTGPMTRGDFSTVQRHAEALSDLSPEYPAIPFPTTVTIFPAGQAEQVEGSTT